MQTIITQQRLSKAFSYSEYRKLVKSLAEENKTTGPNQTEERIEFTKLNLKRTERVEKQVDLLPELITILQEFTTPMYWLVLAEAWCGDVAQNLPVIAKMSDAAPAIELLILLRDENEDIMDAFLTNGTRSIPKVIFMKQDLSIVGQWGPRPQFAQQMLKEHKARPDYNKAEFAKQLHTWYAKDKASTLQQEFLQLLKSWHS